MKRAVVIGGSGFLGSHVADELTSRDYCVTIFDAKPSPWLGTNQKLILGNMLDKGALLGALEGANYLFHFGGVADIAYSGNQPFETINQNVMGATIALEAAIEAGVERFVYASTMYVNSPHGSFYRASKQAAEILIETYSEKFAIDYTLLRYGSLYGPRAQSWNGLQKYVEQAVRTNSITYTGTGRERREYIHVKDAAKLSVDILKEIYKNHAITVTGQQVLNSGELIDLIFEIAGVEPNVVFKEEKDNDDHYILTPYRYVPKAAKKLVPGEFVDLAQGVFDIVRETHEKIQKEE